MSGLKAAHATAAAAMRDPGAAATCVQRDVDNIKAIVDETTLETEENAATKAKAATAEPESLQDDKVIDKKSCWTGDRDGFDTGEARLFLDFSADHRYKQSLIYFFNVEECRCLSRCALDTSVVQHIEYLTIWTSVLHSYYCIGIGVIALIFLTPPSHPPFETHFTL